MCPTVMRECREALPLQWHCCALSWLVRPCAVCCALIVWCTALAVHDQPLLQAVVTMLRAFLL